MQNLEWRCLKCGTDDDDEHELGCPVLIDDIKDDKLVRNVMRFTMIGLIVAAIIILIWAYGL